MVIQNAIQSYLQWKQSYAPVAASRYKTRLDHFMVFAGEQTKLKAITGDQIITYLKSMEDHHGYSRGTAAYTARILKDFCEFWKGRGELVLNPKEIRPIRYASPQKEEISEEDFLKMSRTLDEHLFNSLQKKVILHMLYDTGMRISELCDLNLGDLENTAVPGMRCAKIRRRKTFRYNTVVWGSETNRLLNLYLGIRVSLDIPTDALFVKMRGPKKHLTSRSVQRHLKEISEKAGLSINISPHCFRHAKAHSILDQSGNVRDVQAILGHVNPASSFNYLNVNKTRFIEIAKKYLREPKREQPVKIAA